MIPYGLCGKLIRTRSKYSDAAQRVCHCPAGHVGKCSELPYLSHLKNVAKGVAAKIQRDSTMTTGASWRSVDAGPNRILRWVMLLSDSELKRYGIDMSQFNRDVVVKLREKAASYAQCMQVAVKLTWCAYGMADAPEPTADVKQYLESALGPILRGSTVCMVCGDPLSFEAFRRARRGRAEIETCHSSPRAHDADNVGFAHRECNIAQGNKSLPEFYQWIERILCHAKRDNRVSC